MNKNYIIKKNFEIKKIIEKNKKIISKNFIIFYQKNYINCNRYCVSVSKKIGKANIRNLYKRRIKDILMKNNFNNSCDYVIILRSAILLSTYKTCEIELQNIMKGNN